MLELAGALLVRTESGSLRWHPTEGIPGQFQTAIAGSALSIASPDPDGAHPFLLVLWEPEASRGTTEVPRPKWIALEKLSTSDLMVGAPDTWHRVLAQLWRVARTDALKIDERLDAVLAQLGSKCGGALQPVVGQFDPPG